MKKIFVVLFAFSISPFCKSQNTTEEEYNWMVKGYPVMISSGLDMKKGYSFENMKEYSETRGAYTFAFKFLKRDVDKSLAGIVVIAKSTVSGKTYYYGLPIGSWQKQGLNGSEDPLYVPSDFMSKFEADIYSLDWAMYRALVGSVCNLFTNQLARTLLK